MIISKKGLNYCKNRGPNQIFNAGSSFKILALAWQTIKSFQRILISHRENLNSATKRYESICKTVADESIGTLIN